MSEKYMPKVGEYCECLFPKDTAPQLWLYCFILAQSSYGTYLKIDGDSAQWLEFDYPVLYRKTRLQREIAVEEMLSAVKVRFNNVDQIKNIIDQLYDAGYRKV